MSPEPTSLRRRTSVALAWSGAGQYGASGIRLFSLLALGWLLPPSDFGLLALAMIFVVFAEGIGELGMVSALVQEKSVDRRVLDTAFWCNLVIHLALLGLTVVWAEPVTSFLGDTTAAPLLRLLSLIFLINALDVVPKALLIKELRFRPVSIAQLFGEIGFAIVGLGMAASGFGAWSLAGAVLAQRALSTGYLWRAASWRPGIAVDLAILRRLVRFGGTVMVGTLVDRALINVDYFVIGRFIGTEPLGYYSLAFQLAIIPLDRVVGSIGRVAFPAFAEIQKEAKRLRSGLLEALRHLWAVALPLVICIVVLGPLLLEAIYGDKWAPSMTPIRLLGLGGLCFVPRLIEAALLAVGRPDLRLAMRFLRLIVFAVLVATVGLRHGIDGVALSVTGALATWALANLGLAVRVLGIEWRTLWRTLWPSLRAALLTVVPLTLLLLAPVRALPAWALLILAGTTIAVVYVGLVGPTYKAAFDRWRSS